MEYHGYTSAKGLQTMIMMIAQCPWRSDKTLLSFTGYQCQNYLKVFIAKSLVDVSCTAKEPTSSVAVYGQGNTSLRKTHAKMRIAKWEKRVCFWSYWQILERTCPGGALTLERDMGMCRGHDPLFSGQSPLLSLPIYRQCAALVPPVFNF